MRAAVWWLSISTTLAWAAPDTGLPCDAPGLCDTDDTDDTDAFAVPAPVRVSPPVLTWPGRLPRAAASTDCGGPGDSGDSAAAIPPSDWYIDCDGDGAYGSAPESACSSADAELACAVLNAGRASATTTAPSGFDCNDDDPTGTAAATWFPDCDADGLSEGSVSACGVTGALATCGSTEAGATATAADPGRDCNDGNGTITGPVSWYVDCDEDGVLGAADVSACTGVEAEAVCPGAPLTDTGRAAASTTAPTVADCDDDASANGAPFPWALDCDGDGVSGAETAVACSASEAILAGNCAIDGLPPDAALPLPSAPLDCDDSDGSATTELPWFLDCDGDGFTVAASVDACGASAAAATCGTSSAAALPAASNPTDCDDAANGRGGPSDFYLDCDGDGAFSLTTTRACDATAAAAVTACPGGALPDAVSATAPAVPDCDDTDLAAADPNRTWFLDCDGDDVTSGVSVTACRESDVLATSSCNGTPPIKTFLTRSTPVDCNDFNGQASARANWYRDCDADGAFSAVPFFSCGELEANNLNKCGLVDADAWTDVAPTAPAADCDDADATEFPGRSWFPDCDGDGAFFATGVVACDVAGAAGAGPCSTNTTFTASPTDRARYYGVASATLVPQAARDCNDDDPTGSVSTTWFVDCDGDAAYDPAGFPACGEANALLTAPCLALTPAAVIASLGSEPQDCDDQDPLRFPGAAERCNGVVDDCGQALPANELDVDVDGAIACADCNDADPTGVAPADWYADCDADGFFTSDVTGGVCGVTGAAAAATCSIPADPSRWTTTAPALAAIDCDDLKPGEFPGRVWFPDCDGDGSFDATGVTACTELAAIVANPCGDGLVPDGGWYPDPTATLLPPPATDCNDARADEFPGQTWYADCDGDGAFRGTAATACLESEAVALVGCGAPTGGWVNVAPAEVDCDDLEATSFPGRPWHADCDGDGAFDAVAIAGPACDEAGADAASECADGEAPDGGWWPWSEAVPAPLGADVDCADEDATGKTTDVWYRDCDADTFTDVPAVTACGAVEADTLQPCASGPNPAAWTTTPSADNDCDDRDATEFPGRVWYADCDGDAAFELTPIAGPACSQEQANAASECDDGQAPDGGWWPWSAAVPVPPAPQQDCNDELPPAQFVENWFPDCDGDGFHQGTSFAACGRADAESRFDCDTSDPDVDLGLGAFTRTDPGANADCNDARADEFPGQTWYADCDGDGAHRAAAQTACLEADAVAAVACGAGVVFVNTAPGGGADCDDADESEYPGRPWYADCDGDGAFSTSATIACALEDADAATPCADAAAPDNGWFPWSPGAPAPGGLSADCGDEDATGTALQDWYPDCDGDSFFDLEGVASGVCGVTGAASASACGAPADPARWRATTGFADDCDDADASEFPGRAWFADCDGDGFFRDAGVSACAVADAEAPGTTPCTDALPPDGGWFPFAAGAPPPDAAIADCIDEDPLSFPGQVWYPDCDGDGAFDDPTVGLCGADPLSAEPVSACSALLANALTPCVDTEAPDGGWVPGALPVNGSAPVEDCDDETALRSPLITDEICEAIGVTQIDGDCNCDVNSAGPASSPRDPVNRRAFFPDRDGDGFGDRDATVPVFGCQVEAFQSTSNTDCNDGDPEIYLGAPEICDGIDQNCNGAVDEPDFLDPDNANCAPLYRDRDRDGFGDPLVPQCLCAVPNSDGDLVARFNGEDYVQLNTDCDDSHAFIKPDACNNGRDDDEDSENLLDDADPDCGVFPWAVAADAPERWYRTAQETSDCDDGVDNDGDGSVDGLADADGVFQDPGCEIVPAGFGVQPWPRREDDACRNGVDDDGDGLSDDEDPDCAPVLDVFVDGVTQSFRSTFESREALEASGLVRVETADGHDNECDGRVPVVELDCDDDGALPVPLSAAVDGYYAAEDLGLARCIDEPGQLSCWGEQLATECDTVTGLWVTRYGSSDDGFGGRYSGAYRNLADVGCDAVEDCDDQCPSRCPGVTEACDGLDNDCSGTVDADADADGIPDALDPGVPVFGTVSSTEIDLDGDLALSCVESFRPGAPQTQTVPFTCGLPVEFGPSDCNALCYLAAPGATEACNGFVDLCGATAAEREGLDQDEDGYVTCGAYGPADGGLVEQVFVPVWRTCQPEAEDTDAGASDDDPACAGVDAVEGGPSLVPLIPPRPGGLPCDAPLTDAQDVLLARVGAVRAEVGDASALVGSLCRPESGGVCTVVVLELDATNVVDVDPALSTVANDVSAACAAQPAALTTRTVWPRERVVDARRATVALECLRLFGLPCAEVTPTTPRIGSAEPPDLGDRLAESIGWWPELRRYRPSVAAGALMTCWGDPSVQAISLDVGGDCDDARGNVNRDLPEGPDDVVTAYARLLGQGTSVDCAACFDQVDNNCDGLTDCADPTCAVCFVGGGTGCASGRDACKPPGEGCTAVGNRPGVAALLLFGLFVRRRRRDAAARHP